MIDEKKEMMEFAATEIRVCISVLQNIVGKMADATEGDYKKLNGLIPLVHVCGLLSFYMREIEKQIGLELKP